MRVQKYKQTPCGSSGLNSVAVGTGAASYCEVSSRPKEARSEAVASLYLSQSALEPATALYNLLGQTNSCRRLVQYATLIIKKHFGVKTACTI